MNSSYQYFASDVAKKLISELTSRSGFKRTSSMRSIWQRNLDCYHGYMAENLSSSSALGASGERGEIVKPNINESRSVYNQFVSLITKARLNFDPVAQTSDASSLTDSKIARALIQDIVTSKNLEALATRMASEAGLFGAGYIKPSWRTDAGEPYAVDEQGQTINQGDLELELVKVWDIVFANPKQEDFNRQDWVAIKSLKNRYDLIVQYPDLEKQILNLPSSSDLQGQQLSIQVMPQDANSFEDAHEVYVWEFYHKDTHAVPGGRLTVFGDEHTVFFDGKNPYGCIPLVEMKAETITGSSYGQAIFTSLVASQELLDMGYSIASSNQNALGVQSILVPEGSNIQPTQIGGLNWISYKPQQAEGGGKPSALQLTQTPPEVFNFMATHKQDIERLCNLSGALRGTPPPGVTAASAIATLSTNSLEISQSYSKAYTLALEKLMTMCINIYKTFATTERMVRIAGKNNSYLIQKFKGSDLKDVANVYMRVSNPLALTGAGRQSIAESLLKSGMLKDTKAYLEVLETGSLDVALQTDHTDATLIEAENEDLAKGVACPVLATDCHANHINSHRSLLNNPEIRRNGSMTKAIQDHIIEHLQLAKETDPFLLGIIATGQAPAPQPQPEEEGQQ